MSLRLEKTQTSGDGSVPDLAPLMGNSSLGVTWNLTLPTGHALKGCNYAYKHPLSCWEQIQDWKGTQVSMFMRPQRFNSSLKKQIPGIHGVHLSSLDFLQTTGTHKVAPISLGCIIVIVLFFHLTCVTNTKHNRQRLKPSDARKRNN